MEIKVYSNDGKSYNLNSEDGRKQLPKYIKVYNKSDSENKTKKDNQKKVDDSKYCFLL